jgi:uncharacterized protein (TIRG00374 family)
MEKTSSGKRIRFWFGILLSLASIIAILVIIKPGDILDIVRRAQAGYLLLAFIGLFVFLVLRAVRWRFMLNGGLKADQGIPYSSVFHVQNVGYLVTNILPFRLGDIARAVLIGNVPPITVGQGLSTVVVERVLDLLFIVILFPFTIASAVDLPKEWRAAVIVGGVLSLSAGILLIIAANKPNLSIRVLTWICDRIAVLDTETWIGRLNNLLRGLETLTRWKDASILLLLSVLVWIPIILGYYTAIRAVNLETTLSEAAFVVCIAAFSLAAPSSPGGLGVQEAAIAFAMTGILGFPDDESVGFALIYRALYYLLTGVLGVIGIYKLGETFGSVIDSTRTLVRSDSNQ